MFILLYLVLSCHSSIFYKIDTFIVGLWDKKHSWTVKLAHVSWRLSLSLRKKNEKKIEWQIQTFTRICQLCQSWQRFFPIINLKPLELLLQYVLGLHIFKTLFCHLKRGSKYWLWGESNPILKIIRSQSTTPLHQGGWTDRLQIWMHDNLYAINQ